MKILFLCTGNICRSVMAEAFLKAGTKGKGGPCELHVSSAGLQAQEGMPPAPEVVRVMMEHGLDVSEHRAHILREVDVAEADLILTMALHNSQRLLTEHQEAVERVFTLKEFVIQGEKKGRELAGKDPEERMRDLRHWIRRVEGLEPGRASSRLNEELRLFFLHYFHVYDQDFSIDDPLGQSADFMRDTALEIKDMINRFIGPDLLCLS